MSKHITMKASEIAILQKNLKDLQAQLAAAQKRILELVNDKNTAIEEVVKERQLLVELEKEFGKKQDETSDAIEKQIEDWPDVLDSKDPKSFKQPPQPSYSVREGEKWVKIGADGKMEFEDIEIKK